MVYLSPSGYFIKWLVRLVKIAISPKSQLKHRKDRTLLRQGTGTVCCFSPTARYPKMPQITDNSTSWRTLVSVGSYSIWKQRWARGLLDSP